jgi:hypothetical protein
MPLVLNAYHAMKLTCIWYNYQTYGLRIQMLAGLKVNVDDNELTLFSHVQNVPLCCIPLLSITLIILLTESSGLMIPCTSQVS